MEQGTVETIRQEIFTTNENQHTGEDVIFFAIGAVNTENATEAQETIPLSVPFTITRIAAQVATNTGDADSVLGFRDDGVTVASLTYATTETGFKRSGILDVKVAAESEVCFVSDRSANTVGSLRYDYIYIEVEIGG